MAKQKELLRASFYYEGVRFWVSGYSERELGQKIAEKRAELGKSVRIDGGDTKVSVWIDEWLTTYKEPAVSTRWFKELERYSNGIKDEIGLMKIKDVHTVHIQKFLNQFKGSSKSKIKKNYDVINELFEKATDDALIGRNPVRSAIIPQSKEAISRRSLTDEERTVLLKVADKHKHGLFVKIMLYCGLRPGEVAALTWKNVDIKNKKIKVVEAVKKYDGIGKPKSASGIRTVPIPDALLPDLKRGIGYVCMRDSGKHHTESSIKSLWKSIKRQMDIEMGAKLHRNAIVESVIAKDLTLYCLRHTYCTDLQDAGVPINVAKELMGHSDIKITASIYTHFSEKSFEAATSNLNSFHKQLEAK